MTLKRFAHVDFDEGAGILAAAEALAPSIREAHGEIEEGRRLRGWSKSSSGLAYFAWRCLAPGAVPNSQLRVIEELSAADASVGWCVMINCDGGISVR
jgi:hypothetical protein